MILGTQYRAGLGVSTVIPEIDFETKSSAGAVYNAATEKWEALPGAPNGKKWLGVVGAAVYARHPSTDLLCAAYDLKDGRGWRHWRPGLPPPIDLFEHIARGGLIEAWNVGFERWIWTEVCAKRYGWPLPHMLQWRCAMAKSAAFAYPRALALAAAVLQTPTQKDKDGDRLLKKFSMPRNPTKGDKRLWITPEDDPVDGMKLFQYNHTDIVAEAEASVRLPDLVGENLTFWQLDQVINVRGAPVDRQGILDCCEVVTQCLAKYNAELLALTGIDSAGKVAQIVGWLHARGVHMQSLDEEAVEAALKWNLPAECRRVLEIRKANGSASVKKVFSMALRMTDDDRMHDLYNFYGARTGRPTGEGPQPTNLPKAGPNVYVCAACARYYGTHSEICRWCGSPFRFGKGKPLEWNPGAAEDALTVMRGRSLALLEWVFGEALLTVAGCLRGLYMAARGKILISSDYSAIEAVVAAILADVRWRLEVFATHGKIYEASAATAFGVPLEEILEHKKTTGQHHPLRAKGKINELALGYGGWIGALQAFGAPGDEDELKADVLAWRAASPGLEWIWGGQTKGKADGILENAGFGRCWDKWDSTPCLFGIEGAVVQAIQCPDTWFEVTRWDESLVGIAYRYEGTTLYCRLPSGRFLHYHFARLVAQEGRPGWAIEYEGYNSNPLNGGVGWITIRSWGSRFFENDVQAIAHDIQRYGMLNLEAAGYSLVMHTYDENVSEVDESFGSIDEFEKIMNTMPPWAVMRDGTPWKISAAGGWRAKRYRKE